MTSREINKAITDTNNCTYASGADMGLDHNPRLSQARTHKGQLQGFMIYPAPGRSHWLDLPATLSLIDGRTGRTI